MFNQSFWTLQLDFKALPTTAKIAVLALQLWIYCDPLCHALRRCFFFFFLLDFSSPPVWFQGVCHWNPVRKNKEKSRHPWTKNEVPLAKLELLSNHECLGSRIALDRVIWPPHSPVSIIYYRHGRMDILCSSCQRTHLILLVTFCFDDV